MISSSIPADIVYNRVDTLQSEYLTLQNIFTRKQKYWADGSKITVMIKPLDSVEHKYFVTEWLGITNTRYKRMLESEVYAGATTPPVVVNSDEEMMLKISTTPNSIGYIDRKLVIRGEKNVKILTLD